MKKLILLLPIMSLLSCGDSSDSPGSMAMAAIIQDYETLNDKGDKYKTTWTELNSDSLLAEEQALNALHGRLQALDPSSLSDADLINKDLLLLILEDKLYHLKFGSHLMPLNAEGGFLGGIIYNCRSYQVDDNEDFDNYIKKLNALPAHLEARIATMRQGQEQGKSSPKLVVDNCVTVIDDLLETPAAKSFFITPVKGDAERETAVTELVEKQLFPAYQSLRDYLAGEYSAKAPAEVGVSHITDGKAYYEQRTRYFTTFDISPKEVFDIGQAEVKRIKAEMQAIIDELGFQGSYADFLDFLRNDPQFYPKTPEELLQKAAWITKEMEGELPRYFGKLPRIPLTVKPVPAAIAPNYTIGRYSPGSYENRRAGEYWVNTHKLESRPLYVLPALSLHEGVPGHHLQIMLAAEMDDMPEFRRNTYLSAYGEGWGLYAEFLGEEAGIYKTPYEKFGRLTYEMWRACRLVVDPGMHYMGWTREQAVDFMAGNTALSMHEVNTEINRYIGWPGQAVSYKMGELKIRELRKKAEDSLGDRFDLSDFHDKILENGAVPLNTLERIVDGFINEVKMTEEVD